MLVRLQKFLAEAGLGSRRHCETLISAGQVTVNGQPVTTLGTKIEPGTDQVSVAGQPVRVERKVYIALNKPTGYLCTSRDTHDRPTVFDLLPAELPRLFTVGRLDYDTAGLLLLTNDGTFSLRLTHPRYKMPKTYRVEVEGELTPAQGQQLLHGVLSDGEKLRAEKVFDVRGSRLKLVLREGKKRQVRRMLAAVGHPVTKLTRESIGSITLGNLKPGQWRYLTNEEVRQLVGAQ
ncbi:MAG: Ribosomal large subunit pseudouridine synthase B [Verrucomicrobiae bacterium]|nr:Ribosomal large subunit pseudouridine synthase B [Verrucomicrobiae bacterium]